MTAKEGDSLKRALIPHLGEDKYYPLMLQLSSALFHFFTSPYQLCWQVQVIVTPMFRWEYYKKKKIHSHSPSRNTVFCSYCPCFHFQIMAQQWLDIVCWQKACLKMLRLAKTLAYLQVSHLLHSSLLIFSHRLLSIWFFLEVTVSENCPCPD